jgi:hypothetical protein
LFIPYALEIRDMSFCPKQGGFQGLCFCPCTEHNKPFYLSQRLAIRRLHVKVRRRVVVGIDFYFQLRSLRRVAMETDAREKISLAQL